MIRSAGFPQLLTDFFPAWRAFSRFSPFEDQLEIFFLKFKEVSSCTKGNTIRKFDLGENLNTEALQDFFGKLPALLSCTRRAGFFCNPWAISSLKRNEVRNSAVLAWWLDPHGTHGLGDIFLVNLLQAVNKKNPLGLPQTSNPRCRVRVESHPDGDRENRVDIEIDDPFFFLIIEVKVDAPEGGNGQLKRYCHLAKNRCGNRPWAVLFLTPQGRKPQCAIDALECVEINEEPIIPFSWKELAHLLQSTSKKHAYQFQDQKFPELALVKLLARTFCNHIRRF